MKERTGTTFDQKEEQQRFLESKQTVARVLERTRQTDAAASTKPTRVYFIQENGTDAIKIGVSKHVSARVRELQFSTPSTLTVLATMEGGRGVEGLVKMLFAHALIRREWFRPVPELLAYVAEIDETASLDKRDEEVLFEKRRNLRIIA